MSDYSYRTKYYDKKFIDINPITTIQKALYTDNRHLYYVCPAGRRARKTLIFSRMLLMNALERVGTYIQAAPSRPQAKRIFWKDLKNNTRAWWKKRPSETELRVWLLNGSEIWLTGLEHPEIVEGPPLHGIHITEIDNCKEETWSEHVEPALADTRGFAYLDGVPDGGLGWYYDLALMAAGGALPDRDERIKGAFAESGLWAYYHWWSADVLDPAFLEAKKKKLDPRTYRQEYEGSYEALGGRAYYAFSEKNLKPAVYNPQYTVHIGMDFNVNPMTATFNHIMHNKVLQFGEAYLPNSNTPEMIEHILERFPPHMVTVYPDSTGKAKKSVATESDIALIRKARLKVRAPAANPRVKDRMNSMNSLLGPAKGAPRMFINPETCPKTIDDYNKVTLHDDGREKDEEKERGLTHISSAQGYLVHYNFPIKQGVIEMIS